MAKPTIFAPPESGHHIFYTEKGECHLKMLDM